MKARPPRKSGMPVFAWFALMLFAGVSAFGETKARRIEALEIGTPKPEVYKRLGKPDSFSRLDTNLPVSVYEISGTERYELHFGFGGRLWKLTKIEDGEERIIFMDTRIE